jgi:hypothetical protein
MSLSLGRRWGVARVRFLPSDMGKLVGVQKLREKSSSRDVLDA